jgi:hypothetical protein
MILPPTRGLIGKVEEAVKEADSDLGGFDDRRLFRFEVTKGFNPEDLQRISPEIELVSQEGDTVVVAFVTTAALDCFEARFASMAGGKNVTYRQVIYALQGVSGWSEDDRIGWALRRDGFPDSETFMLVTGNPARVGRGRLRQGSLRTPLNGLPSTF